LGYEANIYTQAKQFFEDNNPGLKDSILILDLIMPEMDGIEKDEENSIIIELALCKEQSPGKVAELLETVTGNCELAIPVNILLAYCHKLIKENKIKPAELLVKLSRISVVNKIPEQFKNTIDWLTELDYMASKEKSASVVQVHHELRQYVAGYAKYKHWIPEL